MEGTRNEKALLVLSSYVIGFTTAYIAYGITYATFPDELEQASQMMTAAVVETVITESSPEVQIKLVADELSVIVSGQSKLISVSAADASLSPAGDVVYFCEAVSQDACVSMQYSIAEDVIRPMDVGVSVDAVAVE